MDERQAEILGMVAPAFAPLAREYLGHSIKKRQLEEKKEMEIEMIEAREEAREGNGIVQGGEQQTDDPVESAISAAENLEAKIDEFKRESWCEACQQAAEALKNQPVPRARQGLQELREMEKMVENGADVDEVADRMEEFEVITDALQEM